MVTIHKFQLKSEQQQKLVLPRSARILNVQVQNDIPCLWALVDTDNEDDYRTFELYGTGWPIKNADNSLNYIGTFQIESLSLVFHLFERLP